MCEIDVEALGDTTAAAATSVDDEGDKRGLESVKGDKCVKLDGPALELGDVRRGDEPSPDSNVELPNAEAPKRLGNGEGAVLWSFKPPSIAL